MTPTATARPSIARIVAAFAVVYVVWGSTYLAIKYVVETMPPLLSAGVRFSLAGGAMFAWLQIRWPTSLSLANWRAATIVGTLLMLGGNGVVCWAEKYVPSGLTALLVGTTPLWFAVLEWLFFGGRRPSRRVVAGLLLGSVGIFVLVGTGKLSDAVRTPIVPALALLGACFSWALGSLYSKHAGLPKSVFLSTAMQMICGGVALTLAGLLLGETSAVDFSKMTARSWLSWAYLVVIGSLVAFTCYVWLLKHASPTHVATYAYVNPVIAVLLGVLVGGERMTSNAWIAGGLIIGAVMLITMRPSRPPVAETGEALVDEPILAATEKR